MLRITHAHTNFFLNCIISKKYHTCFHQSYSFFLLLFNKRRFLCVYLKFGSSQRNYRKLLSNGHSYYIRLRQLCKLLWVKKFNDKFRLVITEEILFVIFSYYNFPNHIFLSIILIFTYLDALHNYNALKVNTIFQVIIIIFCRHRRLITFSMYSYIHAPSYASALLWCDIIWYNGGKLRRGKQVLCRSNHNFNDKIIFILFLLFLPLFFIRFLFRQTHNILTLYEEYM